VELQTTKSSISDSLKGFQKEKNTNEIDIYTGNGWDYEGLVKMFKSGIAKTRKTHIPAVFHIKDVTQPQEHSTSGSHERYKSKERLAWVTEFDCNSRMKNWLLENGIANLELITEIENKARKRAKAAREKA